MRNDPHSLSSEDPQILFVFGAARSGTTYLGRILEDVFDFGMGPEGHFVTQIGARLRRYGNLDDEYNIRKLIDDVAQSSMLRIMREEWREEIRTDITPAMIRQALPENSFAGVVHAVFACVARQQGLTRIGNKNPDYWKHLDRIESLFPGRARYLGIVRDGRDVALSDMRMHWGQSNALACANTWTRYVETTRAFRRTIGDNRFLELRYEDLLNDPVGTVERMAAFLGAEPVHDYASLLSGESAAAGKKDNQRKWVRGMSDDEQRIFESVAADALQYHGYEIVHRNPRTTPGERVRLNVQELFRKIRLNLVRLRKRLS